MTRATTKKHKNLEFSSVIRKLFFKKNIASVSKFAKCVSCLERVTCIL